MDEGIYDDVPEESAGRPPRRRRWSPLRRRRAALITNLHRSASENRHSRERIYAILQGVRIPLLILSAMTFFWLENWPLSLLLFAISIPLPAVAVVLANEKGEKRDPRAPNVYKPALMREEARRRELEAIRQRELAAAENEPDPEPETIDVEEDPEDTDGPPPPKSG